MKASMKRFLLIVVMTVCTVLTAADPTDAKAQYDTADRYFSARKYDLAVNWYRKAADNGYAQAQNTMGVFCLYGRYGVKKDLRQAVFWFRKAAEKGWSPAQCYLGECYENGQGVEKDLKQAEYWYRKAAQARNRGGIKALNRLKASSR